MYTKSTKNDNLFQEEPFSLVLPEIKQLVAAHAEEAQVRNINIDWDIYFIRENAGSLRMFTARAAGKLIGYISCFMTRDIQHSGKQLALFQDYYVIPAYRHKSTAKMLFQFAENALSATPMMITAKPRYGRFFEMMGWKLESAIYKKGA